MNPEWCGLLENGTFEYFELPHGRCLVDTEFFFKHKCDENGVPIMKKARLCLRAFKMRHDIDYFGNYAPEVSAPYLRVLVALAAQHGWPPHGWGVQQAYTNAEEENDVYIRQPPEFDDHTGRVLKVRK